MEAVIDTAQKAGFDLEEVVEMPANNFCLVFSKVDQEARGTIL